MEVKIKEKDEDDIIELVKAMAVAAAVALLIRSFAFEPFNIPSGSLLPTLQIGDYLFVEKYAYGYSKYSFPFDLINFDGRIFGAQPRRGDIAVFRQPKKTGIDYIKRIIGLPGDKIQVRDGVLHINDKMVMRDFRNAETITDEGRSALYKRYIETLPNGVQHYIYEISDDGRYDNTPEYTVPEGAYFAMGDNRDSSLDSRAQDELGFVPAENLIGRAWFIFFSTEGTGNKCDKQGGLAAIASFGCKLVEWPQAVRYGRFFKNVNKI
ncbi:MAG: signal peptidase I [Alphaproteobacteria bacterium]|nr:signal peptidase I [Alphaproteobacteria bacterium]